LVNDCQGWLTTARDKRSQSGDINRPPRKKPTVVTVNLKGLMAETEEKRPRSRPQAQPWHETCK
jgi:hypothetical protein